MAEAEVAVPWLVGVGDPGGVSFVGEVVLIDLFGADEKALLFRGSADEQAGIEEGVVVAGLLVFGGVYLGRQLDGLRPDALVAANERVVDGGS